MPRQVHLEVWLGSDHSTVSAHVQRVPVPCEAGGNKDASWPSSRVPPGHHASRLGCRRLSEGKGLRGSCGAAQPRGLLSLPERLQARGRLRDEAKTGQGVVRDGTVDESERAGPEVRVCPGEMRQVLEVREKV